MVVFRHDRYSKVRLRFVISMESLSRVFWFGYDFNYSNDCGILTNRMIPSGSRNSGLSWIVSSTCVSVCSSIVSSWIYSCSISRSSCHHSCIRQISQSISHNRIPIINAWTVEHKSWSKFLLCLLEDSLFMIRMLKDNIFSEIACWHDFVLAC